MLDFHRSESGDKGGSSLANLHKEQIREATLLILNKCDLAGDPELTKVTRALRQENPVAPIIQTAYGEVSPELICRRASLSIPSAVPDAPASQVSSGLEVMVYRAFRAFHPQRFWAWFNDAHPALVRVKGIVWLATRPVLVGGISRTVWQNSCGAAGIWWAALPREEWPEEPAALQSIMRQWREPARRPASGAVAHWRRSFSRPGGASAPAVSPDRRRGG